MLSCSEVTKLLSESMDRKLPVYQRMAIWIHLLMCKFCTRYRKQLLILREVARNPVQHLEGTDPSVLLPPDVKERMKHALSHHIIRSQ